jgi:hypothetical protein
MVEIPDPVTERKVPRNRQPSQVSVRYKEIAVSRRGKDETLGN